MSSSRFLVKTRQHAAVGMSLFALIANLGVSTPTAAAQTSRHTDSACHRDHW